VTIGSAIKSNVLTECKHGFIARHFNIKCAVQCQPIEQLFIHGQASRSGFHDVIAIEAGPGIEELELLKETTDSLIVHVERLKEMRVKKAKSNNKCHTE